MDRDRSAPRDELQRKIELGQNYLRNIVGVSPQILAIVRLIDQIRDSSVDVPIQCESGTGKELVTKAAQALTLNRRKMREKVGVNELV